MSLKQQIIDYEKGELLNKPESRNAMHLCLFDGSNTYDFTNEEIAQIYVVLRKQLNFAPEENEDWEVELINKICEQIEKNVE